MYPPLAAKPYTELIGNKQHLRLLFCLGYGPVDIADVRIGETPLSQFTNKQAEFRAGEYNDDPITLFPNDVEEEGLSVKLTQVGSWTQKQSAANARDLTVEFTFPTGLTFYDQNGSAQAASVAMEVEYRESGTSTWFTASAQPGIQASMTTQWGLSVNQNLIITMKSTGIGAGATGNVYALSVSTGAVSARLGSILVGAPGSFPTTSILITALHNISTAAQIKAAIEGDATLNALVTVTYPGGGNGSGAIQMRFTEWTTRTFTNYDFYSFTGGKSATSTTTYTANSATLVRRALTWTPPTPGVSYDVRCRRTTADRSQVSYRDEVYWTMLRTVQTTSPAAKKGVAFYALQIQATDQLNGTVDQLNMLVSSKLLDWDGSEWTVRNTSNPASVYRDVMQGRANRKPKSDAQMDLATLQAFHERCAAQGFEFNAIIDFQTTVKQLRQDVLAAARAAFGMRDMKYSVIEDLTQATPVDIITPRTSWGFKWTRRFVDIPHAFKVRFISKDLNYKQDEQYVYADGFSAANAEIFEETDAGIGVTSYEQMATLKRRELADALLRADDYEVSMDFAHIQFTRGDRVQLQHEVILAGLATARVKSVTLNGGSEATAITFDEPFSMQAGTDYGARYRRSDGVQVVSQIVTVEAEVLSVTFSTPIAAGLVPAVGDLVVFGELGLESIDCIVKSIEPGPDYTASIKLQDYAPAIQTAEVGQIPPYDPQITLPVEILTPVPQIVQVVSNEDVLVRAIDGSLQSRIVVSTLFPSAFRLPLSKLETQFRITDSDEDWKSIFTNISSMSVEVPIEPVQEGESYDIRLRTLASDSSLFSAWATISGHVVVGKTSPPPDVMGLVLEGNRLRWQYDNPPRDLAGFYVRYRQGTSSEWSSAIPAHAQILLVTDLVVPVQSTAMTYLVKAVDVSGNESTNAAVIITNFSDPVTSNVIVTVDHRDLGWPGTKTNCTVSSGDLVADTSTPFWTADTDLAWPYGQNDLYWTAGNYLELQYEWSYTVPTTLLDAVLTIAVEALGEWRLEYRTDATALMWNADDGTLMWNTDDSTLMWTGKGDFLSWPGSLAPLQHAEYDFRLIGASGGTQSVIEELVLLFDVPDVEEFFPDLALAAEGTRLPITKTYRSIVVVHVTLVEDGGTAIYTKTVDKHATLGPLLIPYDATSTATTATADVRVQGY